MKKKILEETQNIEERTSLESIHTYYPKHMWNQYEATNIIRERSIISNPTKTFSFEKTNEFYTKKQALSSIMAHSLNRDMDKTRTMDEDDYT